MYLAPRRSSGREAMWSATSKSSIFCWTAQTRAARPVRLDSWTVHGGLNLHNAMSYGSANLSPVADAGDDVTVADGDGNGGEDVRLDGSGSSDRDGTIASYEWIENGVSIGSGATPLIALANGTHTIILQVRDNQGDQTHTDSVIITVNPLAPNSPPVANAGADHAVTDNDGNGTESVTLNGSGFSDSDGSIVSYVWRDDGATVVGTGATASVSLSVGAHTLTLQVTDNDGATATDSVVVTVNPVVPPPPPSVHIGDLDGAANGNKSSWSATVTISVHNGSNHGGVSGATVTGTWSGAASGPGSCTTGSGGTCSATAQQPAQARRQRYFHGNGNHRNGADPRLGAESRRRWEQHRDDSSDREAVRRNVTRWRSD